MNFKSFEQSKRVSTLKIETNGWLDEQKAKALAILAGGYNEIGRDKDLEKYTDLKKRFDVIISEAGSL